MRKLVDQMASPCHITSNNIIDLLEKGIISCVLKQDWAVNRIVPNFFNANALRNNLVMEAEILHLGIGNGECYKYFSSKKNIRQSSISDRLYFDPIEIITLYLQKCEISKELIGSLGRIMRNEFLLDISYDVLFKNNNLYFHDKDILSNNIFKSIYDKTKSYSFNVLMFLLYLLNNKPEMLFPLSLQEQRIVTTMGNKIKLCQIERIEYTSVLKNLNKRISLCDTTNYLINRFSTIDNIYLMDFMNLNPQPFNMFDYIFATRSDAFLEKNYYCFLENIIKYLKPNGFYISDGVVSCYDYVIFYQDLIKTASVIGKSQIFLVCASANTDDIPLRDIIGIIIAGKKASIRNIYNYINPNQIINYSELSKNKSFIRQCAWSDLVQWSRNISLDLETIALKKILIALDKYIETNEKSKFDILLK